MKIYDTTITDCHLFYPVLGSPLKTIFSTKESMHAIEISKYQTESNDSLQEYAPLRGILYRYLQINSFKMTLNVIWYV